MAESDDKINAEQVEVTAETPLIESVSEDVSAEVGEFMEQAAQQNEAAAEAVPDIRNRPGPYISFEHVYKSFGDFVVLEDVSFYVLPGETLCILGRSGVGKSVSLQMLLGFLKPDKGMIKVAGENIAVLSAGTDGVDGNSPAAGAVVDGTTIGRARGRGLDVHAALERFDAYPLLKALGDAIEIGPTGNNLRDLRMVLAY